jgi:iron complex transport system substrate-binding protein
MKHLSTWILFLIVLPACSARTVTDELGRAVTVPEHPHRVVCLMPSIVDDVYALGAGSDVVAVTDYVKYPAAARAKQSVGLPQTPSIEMIVSRHPDLVLEDGEMSRTETIERLKKLGIPVFMVAPHGIEGIYRSIASIGQALNRDQAARELIGRLRARELAVRQRVNGKQKVSVLMPLWYAPVTTIGKHAFITEMIEIAGGHSVTSDIEQEWPQVSLEAVLVRKPEALLLVRGSKMSAEQILTRPGWSNLPAIRNRRIYYVDDRVEIPGPVAFDALEELARQFHP